jgi:hypothetical protein
MLSEAQPCVSAKELLAREMTWTTAERRRRGQPRGSGTRPNGAGRGMTNLLKESRDNGLADSLTYYM